MPQGTELLGDKNSSQGIYIVKQPGNNKKYYLFSTPGSKNGGNLNNGFRYSIVDLELSGNGSSSNPLGDIVSTKKNQLLFSASTEKCAVTIHENCKDI